MREMKRNDYCKKSPAFIKWTEFPTSQLCALHHDGKTRLGTPDFHLHVLYSVFVVCVVALVFLIWSCLAQLSRKETPGNAVFSV